ncbi:hypothetical protein JCM10213_009020 [Rhodosporidiobolus nylandii]
MAPMPPKTSLSKGTLGLKFMNRAVPASPAASSLAGTPVKKEKEKEEKPAAAAAGRMSFGAGSVKKEEVQEEVKVKQERQDESDSWGSRRVGGSSGRSTVVHESSLLSFPLLSSMSAFSSASSSFASTSYSSMPLTSSAISGRRSFGGANIEIEKLNDPSSHQPAEPSEKEKEKKGESKSQLKKRLKAEKDAAPVSVRRSGGGGGGSTLSSAKTGKRTAALDRDREEESGSAKKRRVKLEQEEEDAGMDSMRWEAGDDEVSFTAPSFAAAAAAKGKKPKKVVVKPEPYASGYAKPAGFDGAKKGGGDKKAVKGKGKGGVMGEYDWGKQGDTRAWDEGKSAGGSDSDEEEFDEALARAFDEQEDSEEEDSDESGSEVEEMLLQGKQVGGGRKKAQAKGGKRAKFVKGAGGGKQGRR